MLRERLAACMLFTVSGVRAFSFALGLPFISAGTQYRMPAPKAGKKQQVFMPAERDKVLYLYCCPLCCYCSHCYSRLRVLHVGCCTLSGSRHHSGTVRLYNRPAPSIALPASAPARDRCGIMPALYILLSTQPGSTSRVRFVPIQAGSHYLLPPVRGGDTKQVF